MLTRFNFPAALCFLTLAGAVSYSTLLFRAQPLERDDESLVTPLAAATGAGDYFSAWHEGRILDVDPVRDLSYVADITLTRASGVPTYTFTNFCLWITFCALALSLFVALGFSPGTLCVLTLVLACHPVYAVSVAWIASRKHLLAGVFCLAATLSVVKQRRGATLWYALSVLSHPIHLLWPLWAVAQRRNIRRALGPLLLMLPLAAVNAWYYTVGPYLAASNGVGKFVPGSPAGTALLACGRALLNLLFPIYLSPADYFPGTAANLAGVALLPIFFLALSKRVPYATLATWTLFFFLPLLLLNARSTRVFLSDSYLLVPSLGIWALLAYAARGLPVFPKPLVALILIFAAAGLFATRTLAASFTSMQSLFALAYEREATPQVAFIHAKFLFERGQLREAAEAVFPVTGDFPEAETLFAQAVASDERLTPVQRLSLLDRVPGRGAFFHYFRALTLEKAGRFAEAWRELAPVLDRRGELGPEAPRVALDALRIARSAGAFSPALEIRLRGGGAP